MVNKKIKINQTNYETLFYKELSEAYNVSDINKILQLVSIKFGIVKLDFINKQMTNDLGQSTFTAKTLVSDRVKFLRGLKNTN